MMNFLLRRALYYRPRAFGYTKDIAEAGLFTDDEVRGHARGITDPPVCVLPLSVQAGHLEYLERQVFERLLRLRTLRMACTLNYVPDNPAAIRSLMEDLRQMSPEPKAATDHRI